MSNTGTDQPASELYILLSDRCNFSCSHCLNSAGPKATRWGATDESVQLLAREINLSPWIRMLHFTGGEPTLHLPQIRQLLSLLNRSIPLTLTTNGWFVDRDLTYLDDLALDSVVISHDRFHAPFISLEKLLPLIRHLKSKGKDVSFNFVFSDIRELAYLAPVQELGVKVHSSRIIKSGRAQWEPGWYDTNSVKQTCPSLVAAQRRVPDLDKAVYISGKGFTPCCGPLVFDEKICSEQGFSSSLSEYGSNPLLKRLRSGTFEEQGKTLGLNLSSLPFQSPCDACALLYGAITPGQPSIADLAKASAETAYIPFVTDLTSVQEELLSQSCTVAYTETLDPKILRSYLMALPNPSSELEASPMAAADHLPVIEFVKANYYAKHPDHYSAKAIQEFADFAPEYLSWQSTRGFVYRKAGAIVAAIFANEFKPHSALNIPTLHIGYWGYDRAAVTEMDARWIKQHWLHKLSEWSSDDLVIDASFDAFNTPAIRLARSVGFKRTMLRLDRRTS